MLRARTLSRHETQRGISLVELLVGITVGLFVVAAASMLVGTQLSENRRLLLETQLQQDLRSATETITRELRRAGYWGTSSSFASPAPNPYAEIKRIASSNIDEFSYIRGPSQTGPYGFRLNTGSGSIETRLAASGWHELTDPRTLRITALQIDPDDVTLAPLPCPKTCAAPLGPTDCWPRQVIRTFNISITGEAVHDASIQRTLTSRVRVRNDNIILDPTDPSATRYCPA